MKWEVPFTCNCIIKGIMLQLIFTAFCKNRRNRSLIVKKAFHKTLSYRKYLINCDHSTFDNTSVHSAFCCGTARGHTTSKNKRASVSQVDKSNGLSYTIPLSNSSALVCTHTKHPQFSSSQHCCCTISPLPNICQKKTWLQNNFSCLNPAWLSIAHLWFWKKSL